MKDPTELWGGFQASEKKKKGKGRVDTIDLEGEETELPTKNMSFFQRSGLWKGGGVPLLERKSLGGFGGGETPQV